MEENQTAMWGTMIDERRNGNQIDAGGPSDSPHRPQIDTEVIVVSPSEKCRRTLMKALEIQRAKVVATTAEYPDHHRLIPLLQTACDAFLIELDSDTPAALSLVESICTRK